MMLGFDSHIPAKSTEPAVGAAIGMKHQNDASRSMQADGFADLLDYEFAISLVLGRGQNFRATGDLDGVGIQHADAFEKLSEAEFESVVEASQDSGVAVIF